jgi:hypothetical protein
MMPNPTMSKKTVISTKVTAWREAGLAAAAGGALGIEACVMTGSTIPGRATCQIRPRHRHGAI